MPKLLFSPDMKILAQAVAARDPKNIELGGIRWKRFPDGFPDILVEDVEAMRMRDVAYLACMDSPAQVFEEISVIQTLAGIRPNSFRVLLPYFPTGTMERPDHEGQVTTAHTLAQMFMSVAQAGPGPVPLYIWDLHALQSMKMFPQNIAPRGKWGVRALQKELEGHDVTYVFPDEGALKRFKVAFADKDGKLVGRFVTCAKTRQGDERIVRIIDGDVKDRDAVIVDDLIHSGGTTIECAKMLHAAGARSVSAYATHGVMEKEAWRKFLNPGFPGGFHRVWITDTCPDTAKAVKGQGPFQVLSIVDSVLESVMDGLRRK